MVDFLSGCCYSTIGEARKGHCYHYFHHAYEVFVHRAGHCAFTPAETLTAFQTLIHRLNTGSWDASTDPALMNQEATALGATLNTAPPAFLNFEPTLFLRPFDALNE